MFELTDTTPAVLAGDEARVTDAVEAAVRVDAAAVLTRVRGRSALVQVAALVVLQVATVPGAALALERAHRVDAFTAQAQAGDSFTLVYVCNTRMSSLRIYSVAVHNNSLSECQLIEFLIAIYYST